MLYALCPVVSSTDRVCRDLLVHPCRRLRRHLVWIFFQVLFKEAGALQHLGECHIDHFPVFLIRHHHGRCIPFQTHQVHKCDHILGHVLSAVLKSCKINISDIIAETQQSCEKPFHIANRRPCDIGIDVVYDTVGICVLVTDHGIKLTVITGCRIRSAFAGSFTAALCAATLICLGLVRTCDRILIFISVIFFPAG